MKVWGAVGWRKKREGSKIFFLWWNKVIYWRVNIGSWYHRSWFLNFWNFLLKWYFLNLQICRKVERIIWKSIYIHHLDSAITILLYLLCYLTPFVHLYPLANPPWFWCIIKWEAGVHFLSEYLIRDTIAQSSVLVYSWLFSGIFHIHWTALSSAKCRHLCSPNRSICWTLPSPQCRKAPSRSISDPLPRGSDGFSDFSPIISYFRLLWNFI